MHTKLPDSIRTIAEAKTFICELYNNKDNWNFDDNIFEPTSGYLDRATNKIIRYTEVERKQYAKLDNRITAIAGYDMHSQLLENFAYFDQNEWYHFIYLDSIKMFFAVDMSDDSDINPKLSEDFSQGKIIDIDDLPAGTLKKLSDNECQQIWDTYKILIEN